MKARRLEASVPRTCQYCMSPDDIRRIIANLDDEKLLNIMALQPTVLDIEEASLWLTGDSDIFGPGKPLGSIGPS